MSVPNQFVVFMAPPGAAGSPQMSVTRAGTWSDLQRESGAGPSPGEGNEIRYLDKLRY